MSTVFAKLNLKEHDEILIINAPASFEPELVALDNVRIRRDIEAIKDVAFSLAFVVKQKDLDALAGAIAKKAKGDAIVWFAYPKGSSKKYTCEFNRDAGWAALGKAGFEPVRMVAIDEDWSAVRFRRAEFIKKMTRDKHWARSKEGKKKADKKKPGSALR
jgi:hypothetical protein